MKKILLASAIVGTAAAGVIVYLIRKSRAKMLDRSAGVLEDDVHTRQKLFSDNHHPVDQPDVYSNAMG